MAFLDSLITGEPVPAVDLRSVRIAVPRPDYWELAVLDVVYLRTQPILS